MAAGSRTVRLVELSIKLPASGNLFAQIQWQYRVEDSLGVVVPMQLGNISLDLGTPAAALALTLGQIRTSALAAIGTDSSVPPRESVS